MKILYLNGADQEGGAAKAAVRLLHGIAAHPVDPLLYVQRRRGSAPLVAGPGTPWGKTMARIRPSLEQALLGTRPAQVTGPYCAAWLPDRLFPRIERFAPDLVHLHWVARMMRLETLARIKVPIVWTCHDSWAFTGGCYLPLDCRRYLDACGSCPVLGSSREDDLSRSVWQRKRAAWAGLNLTVVAPSRWMAERARASSLLKDRRIEVIPNGIDAERFRPRETQAAREALGLPRAKQLILFGAKDATGDRNKGFHLLVEALRQLPPGTDRSALALVVFGAAVPEELGELGLETHFLGWQQDEAGLAALYSAADVFVLPSLSENLPYTIMEAMACGTPCVGFAQGGLPDLIDQHRNGYLARAYDPADLARGIAWVLEDPARQTELGTQARAKVVAEFAQEKVAERHLHLYRSLVR